MIDDPRIGEVYLDAEAISHRVGELGADIADDFDGLEPVLVATLKASIPFVTDLSRALPILHSIDFVQLAGYGRDETGGQRQVRFLKDLDAEIARRHVLIVEDVVDTGLTLNFLCRAFALRAPASLSVVSFFDRPYRRVVDDLPLRYVGFTIPDHFYVGYGFDLDERWRNLPDLHVVLDVPDEGVRTDF
jgi:hypoxanthine phosphoribosyltransferase